MATIPLKKTRGRRKVALELMQKPSNRLVTFSKRRTGLFKKASELCTLCGVQAAVIVCSPGDKVFSLGHPTVDAIADRFLLGNGGLPNIQGGLPNFQIPEGGEHGGMIQQINDELTTLNELLEREHKRGEEIQEERNRMDPAALRFLAPVEQLTPVELRAFQHSLLVIREQVYRHGIALFQAQEGTGVDPSSSLGAQAHNPNLDPNFIDVPMPMTHDDPLQMSMGPRPVVRLLRGTSDAPSMMMVPTPRGVVEDLSVARMGPSAFGGQFFPSSVPNTSSFVPNVMTTGFTPLSMMQPMDQAPNPTTEEQFNNEGQVMPSGGFPGFLMGGEGNSSVPLNPQAGEGTSARNPQVGEGSSFTRYNPRAGEGNSFARFNPRAGQGSWAALFNPSGEGSSSTPFNPQGGEGSSFSRFNPRAGEGSSSAPFNPSGEGTSSSPFNPSGEGSSSAPFNPQGGFSSGPGSS